MQKEKYGFVYIWRDRKHNRFYIGCHWGKEDDGYICSSTWMRNAYRRRPQDFKRRILKKITTNKSDLFFEELRWLKMIKKEELGKKYYNHIKFLVITENKGLPLWTNKKRGPQSFEHKAKLSFVRKGKKRSEISKFKTSKTLKEMYASGEFSGSKGTSHTEEWKRKMSLIQKSINNSGRFVKGQNRPFEEKRLTALRQQLQKRWMMTPRKIARDNGEIKYMSDKKCKNGHIAQRFVSSGTCEECVRKVG